MNPVYAVTAAANNTNIQSPSDFWLFVVYCLVVIIVVIFFLFYFNRVLGQILTFLINQYTWRKMNAYIEVDSIRVSLLGGRVLFKNLRYLSTNQSISIIKGHLSIQYWLFNVRKSEDDKQGKSSDLPCRVACQLEGVEFFIYNNVPAYERMKSALGVASVETESSVSTEQEKLVVGHETPISESIGGDANSLFERLMPIQFECTTSAVMIGNTELKSMIVWKASQANGIYSIAKSRSPMDYYKSVLDVVLRKVQVHIKDNMDYTGSDADIKSIRKPAPKKTLLSTILKPIDWVLSFIMTRQYGGMQHMQNWMREASSQPNQQNPEDTTYHEEYARVNNVLECSEMDLTYYADYPGLVPSFEEISDDSIGVPGIDVGNGGLPPEWGIRVYLWDAIIQYGPWADRQRNQMQEYFFPNAHRSNTPTQRLVPGQQRIPTCFETYIEFANEGKLRIPTKEKSKDWKYAPGSSEPDIGPDGYYTRPYGWMDIKVGDKSHAKVTTPFVYDAEGCTSKVDLSLREVDIATSVNYSSFIQSNQVKIQIEMPAPLQWNGNRTWKIKVVPKKATVFLLRDHIYLLQDVAKDWTSLPPADLLHFTPITYQLEFSLEHPTIYLCVNEHNVINNPNSIEDNAFLKVQAHKMGVDVVMPLINYQPDTTAIKFKVDIEHGNAGLSLQTSHTLNAFMREDDAHAAVASSISIEGSYDFYSTVDIARHIESCNLYIKINSTTVKLFGTLIRYLFLLKDNYFGAWNNFSTIDEYRKRRTNNEEWLEQKKKQLESKPLQDPFEAYVLLDLEDGVLLLPENLYECSQYSQLEFQELQLELRNLDVYMDMYLNISPITISRDSNPNPQSKQGFFRIKNARDPKNYVYIDGFNIHAHRLFGPLPDCSTYLCHWNFDIGRVWGEIKPSFLLGLACFGQSFAYNLIDEDNAVPKELESSSLPDVTFLKARINTIDISLMSMNSATNICLGEGVLIEFDNLINVKYSQRITIKIPIFLTRCLANPDQAGSNSVNEINGRHYSWVEVAKADLGLNITIFRHTSSWKKARAEQQNFIRVQDYPTRRCIRLYEEVDEASQSSRSSFHSGANEHHVGIIYAPPFRPFMFGRVEDKSVMHDTRSFTSDVSTPRQGRPRGYSNHSSMSNSHHNSLKGELAYSDSDDEISSDIDLDNIRYERFSVHSGKSRDNDSFHTAKDSDYEDEDDNDEAVFDGFWLPDDYSIISKEESGVTSDDESSNSVGQMDRKEEGSAKELKSAIPPSIPYSDYLRSYRIDRVGVDNSYGSFFHPYVPPSQTSFVPEKAYEEKGRPLYGHREDKHEEYFSKRTFEEPEEAVNGHGEGNEVTATTVIEATRPVSILLTPILVKLIQELTEEITKDDWDLETMLDAIQIQYIEQLTRYLTNQYICTRFAVILPQTYFHFIQNVTVPDGLPSYLHGESVVKTQYDPKDTVLCSADIFMNEFHMIGSVKFEDYAFAEKKNKVAESNIVLQESRVHIDVGDMGSTVQYISKQHERQSIAFGIPYEFLRNKNMYRYTEGDNALVNELVMLDLAVKGLSFKWLGARTPNYVDLAVQSVDSIIITESVEILVGAVHSWLVFVDDLKSILEKFQEQRSKQVQVFINEIANFSVTQAVTGDPVFLTAPTTMLRLGSRNFRNDVGWKLLARMRHCLRSMPLSKREELQYRLTSGGALQGIDSHAIFNNVVQTFSLWRNWEIGYDDVLSCRLITQPFKRPSSQKEESIDKDVTSEVVKFLTSSSNFAKFRLGTFKFVIYEEEAVKYREEENSISINSVEFLLECLFKSSLISALAEARNVDGQHRPAPEGYLDIVTKFVVGDVIISTNPIILAFARHMLLVQRAFTTRLDSVSSQPVQDGSITNVQLSEKNSNSELGFDFDTMLAKVDVVAQALVNVEKIKINAQAQELCMNTLVSGIQGSLLFSNPKLAPLQLTSHADRDSDTGSGKRSSNRGSRRNNTADPRLILEAAGGIQTIDIKFKEETCGKSMQTVSETVLLGILLEKANVNANISQIAKLSKKASKIESNKNVLNVFSNIHKFHIHVPQSLLRLCGFVESWQAEQGRRYHFMIQNLVKEWEVQRKDVAVQSSVPSISSSQPSISAASRKLDIKLQFLLNEFLIQADLLPSLSVEYRILDFFVIVNENHQKALPVRMYSFQLSKQVILLITKDLKNKSKNDSTGIFNLPGIRSTGSLCSELVGSEDQFNLRSIISVDCISMSLDVGLIDTLLTAQSLVGNEISELIEVLSYSKRDPSKKLDGISGSPELSKSTGRKFKYTVDISLDGLRVSASSPSAIGIFHSNLLEASISNDGHNTANQLTWKLQAQHFSLSLDHNTVSNAPSHGDSTRDQTNTHRNCLAYILLDFSVQNYVSICTDKGCVKETHAHATERNFEAVFVEFYRIQTVMQPIAIGKLAEMYIYYDTELRKKRMMKKDELDRLSANTKLIVQSITAKNEWPKTLQNESHSILEGKAICLNVRRLGVAVPLDERSDIPICEEYEDMSALLLSVSSIEFFSKSIEKGALHLENITLQFLKQFDQSKADHFIAENHPRANLINFPLIACHVAATNIKPVQTVDVDAQVKGFEIDMDGTIADYINTLSIIYVKSMDRVNAFTEQANFSSKNSSNKPSATLAPSSSNKSEVVHLDVKGKFNCDSGTIRMYPKRHSGDAQRLKKDVKPLRVRTGFESKVGEINMATVDLPGLDAWMVYQTRLGAHATALEDPKRFHADILIRESRNTLQPAFVQFLREVTAGLKLGIQQSSERRADRDAVSEAESNMNASLLLRLSKTQLDLSCQPISKVICTVGWEASDFLLSSFSKDSTSRTMSCVGSLHEMTAVVKHHFSPEACLNVCIDKVLFNAMLTSQRKDGYLEDDISIVVDFPHLSADMNMRHLQDFLILYTCWLDQPISMEPQFRDDVSGKLVQQYSKDQLESTHQASDNDAPYDILSSSEPPAPFSKHVAIRLQKMAFSVDLGQHIGKIVFSPHDLSLQVHEAPQESKGLSIILKAIDIASEGRLSGSAQFKPISIIGRIDQSLSPDSPSKASVNVASEGLEASFEYEYQNILHAIQKSLELEIAVQHVNNKYDLQFEINLEALIGRISVKTVPVIITMVQRFDELLQKKKLEAGITPRVERVMASKKDHGPTKPVVKKAQYEESHVTSQVKASVQAVEFAIYPSQFQDSDNVDIRAREFKIALQEFPPTAEGIHRKLKATLTSASLAKNVPGSDLMLRYSAPLPSTAPKPKNLGGTEIFGIPGTQVSMNSTQLDCNISHEFDAVFAGRIGVSLNIGLIKYLQEMINMFNLQLERAREKSYDRLLVPNDIGTPISISSNVEDHDDNSLSVSGSNRRKSLFALNMSSDSAKSHIDSPIPEKAVETPLPASTDTKEKPEKFVYVSTNSVNFQPQLQVMGDATPPVEWLGLKRERIPGMIHEHLTLPLDKLSRVIWEVLESQLD